MDESSQGGKTKEKKTRRRLRLSCVECTKRRQKCDRKHPCSLCVTRGVSHLCRWETVPLARPTPARPPQSALQEMTPPQDQSALIAELRKQIGFLEHELESAKDKIYSPSIGHSASSRTLSTSPFSGTDFKPARSTVSPVIPTDFPHPLPSRGSSPPPLHLGDYTLLSPDEVARFCPRRDPLDETTYDATSVLAQLSLAHHGEFIGRGSLICTLHSLAAVGTPRFLYAKSTEPTSQHRSTERFSDVPFISSIEELAQKIPSLDVVETFTTAFFNEANRRYDIPEKWFRGALAGMWQWMSHPATTTKINANWLMLIFAVLAHAPRSAYEKVQSFSSSCHSDDYFMYSIMARRIVEDDFLNVPSSSLMVTAADGTVLGCMATPLLCDYLAQRGRVSEAWKLIGHAIRAAISVGLHRDPDWIHWQTMSAEEKLVRRRAWWGLFMSDKIFSIALGRPQVLRPGVYDVNPFGTREVRDVFHCGQNIILNLMELLGEALERCFTARFPDCSVYFDMDRRFQDWEDHLPMEYRLHLDPHCIKDFNPGEIKDLRYQRYTLHTWYLTSRLKLYIASSVGLGRGEQSLTDMRRTWRECVSWSIRVIHFQCTAYGNLSRTPENLSQPIYPGDCWLFEGCFSLFEAAVALMAVLPRVDWQPWPDKILEASRAIDMAMLTFEDVIRREHGKRQEIAARAIEVIDTLQKERDRKADQQEADALDRPLADLDQIPSDPSHNLHPYMPTPPYSRIPLQDSDHPSHFLNFA